MADANEENHIQDVKNAGQDMVDIMNEFKIKRMEEFDSKELFGRWDISCREFERCINNVVEDLADCVGKIRKYKRISAVFKHKYEESTIDHNSDKICLKRIVQENERLQI